MSKCLFLTVGLLFTATSFFADVLPPSTHLGANADTSMKFDRGRCAGCLKSAEDSLLLFVVRTDADFDSLAASCFNDRIREEWLPPRPGDGEDLVYVSLEGGGCKGCLDIVRVHETSENIVVEVEGGFQGECDMLIIPGAWALIPRTGKHVTLQFHEVICSDDP
jgi:hypothetical protein